MIVKQLKNGIEKAIWVLSIALDVMSGSLSLNRLDQRMWKNEFLSNNSIAAC